ncbi:MAG: tetratricopeptide repeat protein [Verrucomicrobiota bacterium]|nr:tetratricopeptide repeat protein [Limisphaera sp.]MDW8381325.1 tetratricopeptide repeat protein [Verrucomicrobiota bacterium]
MHDSTRVPPGRPCRSGRGLAGLVTCLGFLSLFLSSDSARRVGMTSGALDTPAHLSREDRVAFARYAGSHTCAECHEQAYGEWVYSHHARAERELHPVRDREAFKPPSTMFAGGELFQLASAHDMLCVRTAHELRRINVHKISRAIGVDPMVQYLVPFPGGRLQVLPVAYDPRTQEWFHVFGAEARQPGEWGHWTGRGLNWNSMCAQCHNTAVRKNYDTTTDRYATTLAERGVGCEACHGPMYDHVRWQRQTAGKEPDPTLPRWTTRQLLDICASCHSRRTELTGQFRPGEKFEDHYLLATVDATDTFYPDGQVREENFEWAAFLGSRMHAAGVTCLDCHEPHSGRLVAPGNLLCLQCHAAGQHAGAPAIDPLTHSRHPPGSAGDQCVQCHMPVTTYMQRHPRHDHGFTLPDPWMTLRFGIPNACNRCHTHHTAAWALHHLRQWFRENRLERARARTEAVVQARGGEAEAWRSLLSCLSQETNVYWQSVLVRFLGPYAGQPEVLRALENALQASSALVREAAVRALEQAEERNVAQPQELWRSALADPARNVRIAAAWALRSTLKSDHPAMRELQTHLDYHADQPWGQFHQALCAWERGSGHKARSALEQAVAWDPGSAALRVALATVLSEVGESHLAVRHLMEAMRLTPTNADVHFRLGLAQYEAGDIASARESLHKATEYDPRHTAAWYNLGLARAAQGDVEGGLEDLLRAEALDRHNPRIPYARAVLLARLGRWADARTAALRARELGMDASDLKIMLRAGSGPP